MWPLAIAFGVYCICEGVREAMDENRDKNHALLPRFSKRQLKGGNHYRDYESLADCDYEIVDEGEYYE